MADKQGRVRRSLIRVINDDNLDLYLLGTVALVFTVLGITGISDVKTTSAAVVALLALLAFSQIRTRRLMEQLRDARLGGATALFSRRADPGARPGSDRRDAHRGGGSRRASGLASCAPG